MSLKKNDVKKFVDGLLSHLNDRTKDIISERFGIGKKERKTLASIGKKYDITRERVRQIESSAKKVLTKTETYKEEANKFIEFFHKEFDKFGGVISEEEFLNYLSDDPETKNLIYFLLHLSEPFDVEKRKDLKDKVWFTKKEKFKTISESLEKLYKDLANDKLMTEREIIDRFAQRLKEHGADEDLLKDETIKNLLKISKKIASNGLGQWGLADSRNINIKGVRDGSYLILKDKGEPMHFKDITKEIEKLLGRKVNTATVHNELIKDDRFILVGRGKYGLKEWGKYSGGTVVEVITEVLKEAKKALEKEEIVKKVLERKEVKAQTVIINLSNPKFRRTKDGRYTLAT